MELKILLSVVAGVSAFFIAYISGNTLKSILIPAGIAGVLTMLPVFSDSKSLGFFGPIGFFVFVILASIVPAISSALGCGLGFLFRDLKQEYLKGDTNEKHSFAFYLNALKKTMNLTPEITQALIIPAIGILLMCISYIVLSATHENISSDFKTLIMLLNPIGLILLLYGLNNFFKK
jgi:hypothetical protein